MLGKVTKPTTKQDLIKAIQSLGHLQFDVIEVDASGKVMDPAKSTTSGSTVGRYIDGICSKARKPLSVVVIRHT